jgi:hypothetical protein
VRVRTLTTFLHVSNLSLLGMVSHFLVMTYFIFPRTCDTCLEPPSHWPPVRFNFIPIHIFSYKSRMCLFEVKLTLQLVSVCFHLDNPFGFITSSFNICFSVFPFFHMCLFHKNNKVLKFNFGHSTHLSF